MGDDSSRGTILALLRDRGTIRNRDVATALGISRQAAHRHLRGLVSTGDLVQQGAGRGVRYGRPAVGASFRFPTGGLAEDRVWDEVLAASPDLQRLGGNAERVFHYVLTELVNNAIDHSGSAEVRVVVGREEASLVLVVEDDGDGIFAHLRHGLGLESDFEALEELVKGKTTTMPDRHTGEGIFFVSKASERFVVESGRLRWIVDNRIGDFAVEQMDESCAGTRLRFVADPASVRDLKALFDEYTVDFEFVRTRTVVKLYAIGVQFVSRSEAKRLVRGLDAFREVVLDFEGVTMIGQGFADEIFRVWQRSYPEVRLVPVSMAEPVAFMVERALRGR